MVQVSRAPGALADVFRLHDCQAARDSIVQFLRQRVGAHGALVGLSGGIDSAVTCRLAVDALGSTQVTALLVKNHRYTEVQVAVSKDVARQLGITTIEVDTHALQVPLMSLVGIDSSDVRKATSLDARVTDLLLRTIAEREGCIYLGTINATERLTGWFPKGALVGDFNPIGGLLKHQVQQLAAWYGLPHAVVDSVAADASRICSGCGELSEFRGIPYAVLDAVLCWYEVGGAELAQEQSERYQIAPEVVSAVMNRVAAVAHKQTLFAPYPSMRS